MYWGRFDLSKSWYDISSCNWEKQETLRWNYIVLFSKVLLNVYAIIWILIWMLLFIITTIDHENNCFGVAFVLFMFSNEINVHIG